MFGTQGYELEIPRPSNMIALERQYGISTWVYICCRRKARDLASAPFIVTQPIDNDPEGDREVVPDDHPLVQVLNNPNPWMSMRELTQITSTYLDLCGNAFWMLFRGADGLVREMFPVNPFAVRIWGTPDALVSHYSVQHWGRNFDFVPGDMIHFALDNPLSFGSSALPQMWGIGPLEASWTLVLTDDDAVRWNRNLLKNDGRPTGMLTAETEITATDSQTAADRYREVFAGPQGAGKILVLGKGLKYERVSLSPQETDYHQTRILLREEIIATFGLNSAVLGLAQGDTGRRAEMHREYWEGTVASTSTSDICPALNEYLAEEYGPGLEIVQDFSGIRALQENMDEQSKYVQTFWQMGVKFNELNRRFKLGFDETEEGDVSFVSISMQPAALAKMQADDPASYGPPPVNPQERDQFDRDQQQAASDRADAALEASKEKPKDKPGDKKQYTKFGRPALVRRGNDWTYVRRSAGSTYRAPTMQPTRRAVKVAP